MLKKLPIRNGGYELQVRIEGNGPAVLLIHGLAGDHQAWNTLVGELTDRFTVIAPDNRGAGQSTQRDEPVSIAEMAADMLELLDGLGVGQVHVVGRSMGGCIGQEMCFAAPGRVASLAMLASCAKCDPTQVRAMTNMREALMWRGSWADHARHSVLNFVSHRFYNENPERMAAIEAVIASENRLQACYVHQNLAVIAHDVLDRLSTIRCPVLIAHGGRDPLGSPTGTAWMVERLPHADVVCFEDSSHFFFMEEPHRFSTMINGWLDQQALAGRSQQPVAALA